MLIKWTEDLATGHEVIDGQHRELYRRINVLLAAAKQGRGKADVGEFIRFLSGHVLEHFRDEEKLQLESAYPDYIDHKKQHEQFKNELADLIRYLEINGVSYATVIDTLNMSIDWLARHIMERDKPLAEYLRENSVRTASKNP
jgi:hemerythrin